MTRVKVSGITSPGDAEAAVEAGADALACVFYSESPRYVTLEQAWEVRRAISADTLLIGVFVDAPVPLVRRIVAHCGLASAQLFGRETRDDVDAVGCAFKAITVGTPAEAIEAAKTYLPRRGAPKTTPALLFHLTGDAARAWDVTRGVGGDAPVLIASGALEPAAAAAAVREGKPWGLDVWETVEVRPGKLDPHRLRDFVSAVRDADAKVADQRR